MAYETVIFDVQDGIGLLTLNRPKAFNAFNDQMLDDLSDVIEKVRNDSSLRVLVLKGAGEKAFVAGADVGEFQGKNSLQARMWIEKGQEIFFRLEALPIPIIACVNGFALGGGLELALSCDFIYASEKAKFALPEINLGIHPGWGGTQRLTRLIGRAKTKELAMTGEMIDGKQAFELGLAAKLFPSETLFEETMKVAKHIASRSQLALRCIKLAVDRGVDTDLRTAIFLEAQTFGVNFAGSDAMEGVTAFLEKRQPDFKGSFEK
ncbi:MAG: enoyl-CoA hydratase/isomerase family protein [Syntrophobacteraceae bacterium]